MSSETRCQTTILKSTRDVQGSLYHVHTLWANSWEKMVSLEETLAYLITFPLDCLIPFSSPQNILVGQLAMPVMDQCIFELDRL